MPHRSGPALPPGLRRSLALAPAVLAAAGALAAVHARTGTQGLLVGAGLALLPAAVLLTLFRWLDSRWPAPRGDRVFAFVWGGTAAFLSALWANAYVADRIGDATTLATAQRWSDSLAAPVIEETAKAAGLLILFLHRRGGGGPLRAVVLAGLTATGFTFLEDVLYLGTSYDTGGDTVAAFLSRALVSPVAHPLFTAATGLGFGLAARARGVWRAALPAAGLVAAIGLHSLWNTSALGGAGFAGTYAPAFVPLLILAGWLVYQVRQGALRVPVRRRVREA